MTNRPSRAVAVTSAGHALGEATYLDARYLAAQPEYEAMLRWAGIEKSWQVLDAGSGSGSYLPLLCELVGAGGGVTEFDLAPENIQACQARLRDLQPAGRVETRVGSLLELPFGEASFDAVWCANTLQYLSDEELAMALSELKRVTCRGGRIAIKEADVTCLQIAYLDPGVNWRYLEAARRKDCQMAGLMRTLDIPHWLTQAGLVNVRWLTTLIVRFGPLQPVEVTALGDIVEFTVQTALSSELPEDDLRQWRRLWHGLKEEHLLEQADFFFREGAVVVVGEVE